MQKHSGFTIVELMTVIAILAVMTAIAVPNFLSWIPEKRLMSASDDVFSNLQYARIGAIRNNTDWALEFNTGANSYIVLSDYKGTNTVVKSVALSSYGSGVCYGMGRAAKPKGSSKPADGVSYLANRAIFNSRGMANKLGYVYLTNDFGSAVVAGTPALAGVVVQKVWTGSGWE
jgi:prepilin-type N-terminal cleavage/methylation domain-containing protein